MTVTRFAPSPTGFLHIGGARTALFSWLYARSKGGKYLLRIEDTDRERSTPLAVAAILDGLSWLGLTGDEPPVYQGLRADRHQEIANELVRRGAAYLCPVTPAELQARRDEAEALQNKKKAGETLAPDEQARMEALLKPFRSPWRDPDRPLPAGAPTVIRLRMPEGDAITIRDHVQGEVSLKTDDLDDLILLRSDGAPTYMLAVVVDDHDMGVTHVIRGDDHFMNTFRQAPIFQGMGWPVPEYAHIPLIHGPDGKKLSKRHGALGVDAYRDMGFLPEALKNYLARLGWSHGDDELFSEAQAIKWFDLAGLNKAPARLDFDKLRAVNAHYMALADDDRLFELFRTRPEAAEFDASGLARIRAAMSVLKLRAPTLADVAPAARFLGALRPISLEGKAAALLTEDARQHLSALSERFAKTTDWSAPPLKQEIATYCEDVRVSLGKVGPVLRAVLTGGAPAPDIAVVLALLGREESLARIADQAR